jgi:hypothetical protein
MSSDDQPTELPADLVKALKSQHESARLITARVDRAITQMAAEQFAAEPRRTGGPVWFALAASLLVAVFAIQTYDDAVRFTGEVLVDVDGSGQIDIADVLALARNSDDLSQREIDALAMQMVSLDRSGDSS